MKYSSPSGISESNPVTLTVFPNPCLNKLNVEMIENGLSKSKLLEIVNLAGETLAQLQTEAINIQIDVCTYPAGIYLIKIRNENSVWSGKFCKI
jgi:Secretion system C-terminal sorting domain